MRFARSGDCGKLIPITAILLLLQGAVTLLFFASFLLGRYAIEPSQVVSIIAAQFVQLRQTWPETMETVVLDIRLPRIMAAILVGGALSVAGATSQAIFRNPLVSPAILGVSAGAGFGAALGMLLSFSWLGIQILAFLFGLLAVACSLSIGRLFGAGSLIVLVLAGMVVAAIFQALISITKYLADPVDKLPNITFWMMGGLAKVSNHDLEMIVLPICLALLVLYLFRWQINVLAVGEAEAGTLGVDCGRVRIAAILCSTLLTAAAVSIGGMVGWVGLLVPHMARMLVGPNFHRLLPVSFLLGGGYLLLVDDLGRSMFSTEVPLGILTALVGAPFFIFLLAKTGRGWS